MAPVKKQYIFLLGLTGVSLLVFCLYFFFPTPNLKAIRRVPKQPGGPLVQGTRSPILLVDYAREAGLDVSPVDVEPVESIPQVMSGGAAMVDVNGDGLLDLYLVRGGLDGPAPNRLYINAGGMRFVDLTDQAGAGDDGDGMGCVFGDVDNDGDPDLYVTNNGRDAFFRNNGLGTFDEETETIGLGSDLWGAGVAMGDVDRDGYVDLYVVNYLTFDRDRADEMVGKRFDRPDPVTLLPHPFLPQRDLLYRNEGGKRFVDVTQESGIQDPGGRGLGVILSDVDGDGDLDIYVANDFSANTLYANRGSGTFTDAGVAAGLDDPRSGMGVASGDWDNDGDIDIFAAYWANERNALYQNTPAGSSPIGLASIFEDVGGAVGLAAESRGLVGWGTGFLDYDNDGYLDILVVNGYTAPGREDAHRCKPQQGRLFRNREGLDFESVSVGPDLLARRNGRGAAFGDVDRDGDVDVLIATNRGVPALLQNDGGHWKGSVTVRLEGTRSNRSGIGARVILRAGGKEMVREIQAGSSYLSCSALEAQFGLGGAEKVDSLVIRWPSGKVQAVPEGDIIINGMTRVTESR